MYDKFAPRFPTSNCSLEHPLSCLIFARSYWIILYISYSIYWRRRVIGISGSLIWLKTLMELICNPCGEFRWSPENSAKSILLTSTLGLLGSIQIFKVCLNAKQRGGAESNVKLPHLFISSKTATLVPEFAAEDLPLARTVTSDPAFVVKHLP